MYIIFYTDAVRHKCLNFKKIGLIGDVFSATVDGEVTVHSQEVNSLDCFLKQERMSDFDPKRERGGCCNLLSVILV